MVNGGNVALQDKITSQELGISEVTLGVRGQEFEVPELLRCKFEVRRWDGPVDHARMLAQPQVVSLFR